MTFIFHEMRSPFPTNSRPDYLLILYDKYRELLPHIRYNGAISKIFHEVFILHRVNPRELIFLRRFIDIITRDPLHLFSDRCPVHPIRTP